MATGTLVFVVTAWGTAWLGITRFLIGIVAAIVFTIATPGTLHALRVRAQKLIRLTFASMTATMFVRSVRAMGCTVANVRLVNALTIHAGCLILVAGCRRANVIDIVHCVCEGKRPKFEHVAS